MIPGVRIVPYQAALLTSLSNRVCVVKARRVGFSWAAALRAAMRAAGLMQTAEGLVYRPDEGVPQRVISASMNQASAYLGDVRTHLIALGSAIGADLIDPRRDSETRIRLANGIEIHALSANPRTARGAGADLTIDEAGAIPDPAALWQAAKATVDPTLGRPQGYCLTVIGTPLGDDPDNILWKCARGPLAVSFEQMQVDIYGATDVGFPADPEALREECGSQAIFDEEYGCQFGSSRDRLISEARYDDCLYDETEAIDRELPWFGGYDVARSAKGDNAALVEGVKDVSTMTAYVRSISEARGRTWEQQEETVAAAVSRAQRLAIDSASIGSMLAERLCNAFPGKVLPVDFSSSIEREQVVTGLVAAFEKGRIKVPRDHVGLRRAVLSLRRETGGTSGRVRYVIPRTKHGHGDCAVGTALFVHASGGVVDEVSTGQKTWITAPLGIRAKFGIRGGVAARMMEPDWRENRSNHYYDPDPSNPGWRVRK